MDVLSKSLQLVKKADDRVQQLWKESQQSKNKKQVDEDQEALTAGLNPAMQKLAQAAAATGGVKDTSELLGAWKALTQVEKEEARLQDALLQTLILISVGNMDTTRQVVGAFWVYGTEKLNAKDAARNPKKKKGEEAIPFWDG